MLTSEMVRAARALLRWEQADLAEKAGISLPTIKRLEKEPGPIPGTRATAQAIETAFAKARIEFSYDRGEGVTRLKKEPR
ncbi:helix-turn-helix domain-containing protein [Bradyrhizobium arachidis]|uniref:Helix-turn-helix domain-containing protein n=2 Tax=Bradyrhizobium arachidis TaxID=858423 RepID=A0AAE7NYB0_9BRAD|nr:helix-turn-helix domain-containing protein [Bradyrhizobium arachidis]QOZ73551.1 helix-turn-helix domain-containing protein [Bradyrhizobium arachidis]